MLKEFLLAIVVPPLLLLGWVAVQGAWRRRFSSPDSDGDVLAARGGCGRCGCVSDCISDCTNDRANPRDADSTADNKLTGRSRL